MHEEIKKRRLSLGWTQTDLAEAVNSGFSGVLSLTKSTISSIESGNRNPGRETMEAIAETLDMEWRLCQK